MNIEKLEVGTIYKNYKTLCADLDEQIKTGKSKQLQIEEWNRFFEYEKAGYSFIITKIYDTPKVKIDLRSEGNSKVKYIEKIEKLILDLLVQEGNDGQVFLSKNKLLVTLKMVNDNYSFGMSKPFRLSKLTNITPKEIEEFYSTSDSMLKRNLEAALNSLRNQALIIWHSTLTVCYVDTELVENDNLEVKATKWERKDSFGDSDTTFDIHQPKQKLVHRRAEVEEEQLILEAEKEVLDRYGCKTISDIFKSYRAEEFYKDVREILFEKSNIFLYYNSYEIINNKNEIVKEWKLQERAKTQSELNEEIAVKIESNAENRHENSFKKLEESDKDIYKIRSSEKYLENAKKLTEVLIKKDSNRIRYI